MYAPAQTYADVGSFIMPHYKNLTPFHFVCLFVLQTQMDLPVLHFSGRTEKQNARFKTSPVMSLVLLTIKPFPG